MIWILISLVVPASALWVYLDATKYKIGNVPGENLSWNMSAGHWAAMTLFIWIICFPAYLVKRPTLIARAKESPMEPKNRALGVSILGGIGAVWIIIQIGGVLPGSLPACDSTEVFRLAEQLVRESPYVTVTGVELTRVSPGGEAGFDAVGQKRTCWLVVESELGQQQMPYTVTWQNELTGAIWVQLGQ